MLHHIRKQTLQVAAETETLALALQPRLQDLNRTTFLPIIERVFDECSVADRHVFLARLDVDLGTIAASELDHIGPLFERKLREAVRLAIDRIVEERPSSDGRLRPAAGAKLEALEQYLVSGTLPFWTPAAGFVLSEWIEQLSADAPQALIELLARRQFDDAARQRIAYQLGDEPAQRLFQSLASASQTPAQDAGALSERVVAALLGDERAQGEAARWLVLLDQPALENIVQRLVPEHADRILADAAETARRQGRGRANETMRSVLLRLAADGRLADRERARSTAGNDPVPAQPDEAREARGPAESSGGESFVPHEPTRAAHADEGEDSKASRQADARIPNDLPDETRLRDLYRTDRSAFVALIRELGYRPPVAWFLRRLDGADLEELVLQLSPNQADQIGADVPELATLPFIARQADSRQVLRHLWLLAAEVQLNAAGRRYDRREFVDRLLAALADSIGTTVRGLFAAIRSDATFEATARSESEPDTLALRSIVAEIELAARASPAGSLPADEQEPASASRPEPMFARYDRIDAAQYYLRYGVLPFSVSLLRPELTSADAFDALAEVPLPSIRAVLADHDAHDRLMAWHRVVQDLPRDRLIRLVTAWIERALLPLPLGWPRFSTPPDAGDDSLAYARFIVRLIQEGRTDDAVEAARTIGAADQPIEAAWEADRIKAVLAGRVAGSVRRRTGEPTSLRLLLRLIERDLDDARRFLEAMRDAGLNPSALADEGASASAVESIRKLTAWGSGSDSPGAVDVRLQLEAWFAAEAPGTLLSPGSQAPSHPSPSSPASPSSPPEPPESRGSRSVAEPERALPAPADEAPREWLSRLGAPAGTGSHTLSDDAIRHALLRAIDDTPAMVHEALVQRIDHHEIRERWAAELSEPELVRLTYLLEPRLHRPLIDALELLFSVWLRASVDRDRWQTRRPAFWSFFFTFLADTRTTGRSLDRLIAGFMAAFRVDDHATPRVTVDSEAAAQTTSHTLLDAMIEGAAAAANDSVREILVREREALLAPPHKSVAPGDAVRPLGRHHDEAMRVRPETRRLAFTMEQGDGDAAASGEPIYVANAGLVLANPFLPQWCRALDLLESPDQGRTGLRADRFSRAVHLLQWLVDAGTATPEPLLCLNKLLCGGTLATPVERRIEATARELEVGEQMLRSMIANWTIISNTSIEGLRETFLQREGRLERTEGGWRLTVQRKTVDVLIDHIPWSISTIFHDWMPEPISVMW